MNKIKVIDSPMGYGKTSYLIQMINEDKSNNKYIFITPFLDECERIQSSCKTKKFIQPTNKNKKGSKLESLKQLIIKEKNIVSTHSLFSMLDEELITLIKSQGYILLLDEVMNVVESVEKITKDDISTMIEQKFIKVEDEPYNKVIWCDNEYNGRYNDIKIMAENESLFYVNNTLMVWTMPIKAFESFEEVYISTYMFNAQIQKYYYDYFNMQYEYYHVAKDNDKYKLIRTLNNDYDVEFKKNSKKLIHILDNSKLNAVGDNYKINNVIYKTALSKAWYDKNKNNETIKILNKNIYNYFYNYCNSKSDLNMWTTYLDYKSKLKGKGYTKGFVSCSSRGTNQHSNKKYLAYTINRYLNPFYKQFFYQRNIEIDEDMYSLSEMLQWIWRSCIRNNEEIYIYIPSERMRNLLIDFLNV